MQVREGADQRAKAIRLLLLDVDGVLTDGRFLVGPDGEESKQFHARDGLGIRLAQRAGLAVGLISGRSARSVERRAAELDLAEVHLGVADKLEVLSGLLARREIAADAVAFMGDDLVDVPVMRRVGFAATVAEASSDVARHAHLVTAAGGGMGAVREMIEYVLRAQGCWASVVECYGA